MTALPGDNPITDAMNLILPDGRARMILVSLVILAASAAAMAGRLTLTQLMARSIALLALSLFFMGPYFLSDYFVILYIPALMMLLLAPRNADAIV